MDFSLLRGDLPVLLLYNLDHTWPAEDIDASLAAAETFTVALREVGHTVTEACLDHGDLEQLLRDYDPAAYVVFNWCEELPGAPRSAARVAQILEQMGFAFTGAGSQALVLAQDKRRVKQALYANGISTPRWKVYQARQPDGWRRFPAIVKPAFEHCSFGVTRQAVVESPAELKERLAFVLEQFDQPALVEEFIDGREFHVSVVGNGRLHVLPPAEMDFSAFGNVHDRLCTYESKHDPASAPYRLIQLHLPAPLSDREQQQLQSVALAAYQATGCRDYARLDLRMRDGVFYLLDVNPNADFSPDTSLALAAEMVGISYGQLGSWLINLAACRHRVFGNGFRED
jgi:D-alanine-D-alanine ligase